MVAVAAAMGCIVALTAGAMWRWRKSPGVTIGWLWFVIALLPMIGLIQSGAQSMADRFTYLPMIGLLVAVAWAVPWRWVEATGVKWAVGSSVAGLLIALGMTTRAQIAHWRD